MKATRTHSVTGAVLFAAVALIPAAPSPASAQTRHVYRLTTLGLVDPPIYTALGANPCAGPINILVNAAINMAIGACTPVTEGMANPCNFEFNIVAVFDPLVQTAGANSAAIVPCMSGGQPCELQFAVLSECTRQSSGGPVNCNGAPSTVISSTYSNGGSTATCLGGLPGTFGPNNSGAATNPMLVPATGNASNNCGVSGELDLTLELGDGLITIPLKGAQLAARYSGNPATGLTTGLARGFLSETDADDIIIDVDQSGITIKAPLSELLPGGTNNCRTAVNGEDDRDRNPPDSMDGERGWWFYLSFAATEVTAPEFPTPTATAPEATPTATPAPPTDTPIPTDTPTFTPAPTDTPSTVSCPGDCNGDGVVPINEVVAAANVYLETAPVTTCAAADRDNSARVEINEVVQAAQSYQFDCPH